MPQWSQYLDLFFGTIINKQITTTKNVQSNRVIDEKIREEPMFRSVLTKTSCQNKNTPTCIYLLPTCIYLLLTCLPLSHTCWQVCKYLFLPVIYLYFLLSTCGLDIGWLFLKLIKIKRKIYWKTMFSFFYISSNISPISIVLVFVSNLLSMYRK